MQMDILACVDRIDKRVWAFARTTVQLDVVTDSDANAIALQDGTHPNGMLLRLMSRASF